MNILLDITITFTLFSGIGLIISLILPRRSRLESQRVLEAAKVGEPGRSAPHGGKSFIQQVLIIGPWLRSRFGISEDERVRERFTKAGLKGPRHANAYFTARFLGPVLVCFLGTMAPSHRTFWMVAPAGIAYLAPDLALKWMIKRRRERIRKSVPDAVDLLVICVDAGLGIDQAMLRVGQELSVSHPEITEEFLHINREQRAGKPRLQAWKDMAVRTELPDMDAFVNMLVQTERFGTPIARALSNFADNIRLKRRQKAEELAAKTTVKIIFPLVLFIFPSMFIVLIGPAAINIVRGMSTAGR